MLPSVLFYLSTFDGRVEGPDWQLLRLRLHVRLDFDLCGVL